MVWVVISYMNFPNHIGTVIHIKSASVISTRGPRPGRKKAPAVRGRGFGGRLGVRLPDDPLPRRAAVLERGQLGVPLEGTGEAVKGVADMFRHGSLGPLRLTGLDGCPDSRMLGH